MDNFDIKIFLVALLVIGFIVLGCVAYSQEKQHCVETGGKWVEGVINGDYSYFCIPN